VEVGMKYEARVATGGIGHARSSSLSKKLIFLDMKFRL
jgi:hypothetical protein